MSSRLQRSSVSPFRLRKTPSAPGPKPGARPTTPSTGGARPTTPSYSSTSRPTTPSSSTSLAAPVQGPTNSRISPVSGATSSFSYPATERPEFHKSKENVTVTVRFRPLSLREIGKGDEIAWYADGDSNVRNESNPGIVYGFDRVFGPATTTRHVYDVAAQHVVSGAMQGINGTVFAYGVTSSGKTHTMHGEQKSPGIIPLAVKDVFSIIQETPGREFLLRVSYLEIYNEVINDLLDPAGQNLRIREDSQEQMQKLSDEIIEKKLLLHVLEQRMIGSLDHAQHSSNSTKISQNLSKLATQLTEKTFELEIMSADNRILQDQLQMKISDNANLEETIKTLNEQLNYFIGKTKENGHSICNNTLVNSSEKKAEGISLLTESSSTEVFSISTNEESMGSSELLLKSQVLTQAAEIENLKQKSLRLAEEKDGLQIHCQKLAEEASYARELAAAAAVELRNLAEEVTKLSYENAKLTDDFAASMDIATGGINNSQRHVLLDGKDADDYFNKSDNSVLVEELRKELLRRCERESSLEAALSVRDQRECELKKTIDESKQHEQDLETELASMWVLVAKLKKSGMVSDESLSEWFGEPKFHLLRKGSSITNGCSRARFKGESFSDYLYEDQVTSFEEIRSTLEYERRRCKELEVIISKLKGEDLDGLDVKALEEMQNCHVEALSKICQEKLKYRTLLNQEDETAN